MNENITGWFTTEDGVHIPIKAGKSKIESMNEFFESRTNISNKKIGGKKGEFIERIKHQTNVDLLNVLEERTSGSRKYLGVHLENLPKNEENRVRDFLHKKDIQIGDNGGYGQAIYY